MTREEAIKIINCYDIGFYDLSGAKIPADKLANAFDMAIEALSAEAVQGYTEWLEKIIVMLEPEYLCEDTTDKEWCEENCHHSSIQAECLRHLYEAEQVTGKLKKPCDSLLTGDSDECKEQKSKLESAEAVQGWIPCSERLPDVDIEMDRR